jgi:hypothetical protein
MHGAPSPTGCGSPSVWSADGRATVLSCIGCGRIDTAQQCAGTCGEYRLEIVAAAGHDRVLARLDAERRRGGAFGAVVRRLTELDPPDDAFEAAYRSLQGQARAVLRSLPAADGEGDGDEPAERLPVWSCGCCGRVEAEAPCVGVCTDERLEVVRADVHDEVCGQLRRAAEHARDLSALVRGPASVTPRPGGWEASFQGLQRRARALAGSAAR